jgi:putative transposase
MGEKKVNGRKRHLGVDTQGYLLRVLVHAADVQDRDGARPLLEVLHRGFPCLSKLWVDGAYAWALEEWARERLGITLEVVKKLAEQRGVVVLPRRWLVERTIAWVNRNRRLSKDYEHREMCSESLVYLASIRLLLRRLTKAA